MQKTIITLILLTITQYASPRAWFPHRKAYNAYLKKDLATAKEILEKEQVDKPNDPLINYNLGAIYYKESDYDMATESFQRAATHAFAGNKNLLEKSYFNLGNSLYQTTLATLPDGWEKPEAELPKEIKEKAIKLLQQVIEKYQSALKISPENKRTQANKKKAEELLAKLQNKQQNKQNKKQNDKQDKNNKSKDDKDQKQNKQQQQQQKNKQNQDNKNQDKKDQKKQDQNKKDPNQNDKKQNKQNKQQQQQPKPQNQQQNLQEKRAQALLKELENDEKKLQKKLFAQNVKMGKHAGNKNQKPW